MYRRSAQGWAKHIDFIVIDEISLQGAFILSVLWRQKMWAYSDSLYQTLGFIFILIDALVLVLHNSMHNVIQRGYYQEIVATLKHCFYVFAIAAIYMFTTQSGAAYSRAILFLSFFFYLVLGYVSRILWKVYVKKNGVGKKEKKESMLVVTTPESARTIVMRLSNERPSPYKIVGVVLTEQSSETDVAGYPIVTDLDGAADYIVREWVDSVYIDAPLTNERIIKLMDDCTLMAVPTHYHVPNMSRNGTKRFSEKIGGTT